MLTNYFNCKITLERYRSGMAGPYLDEFVTWLGDRGYRRSTIRRYARGVVHFANWANTKGLSLDECGGATLNRFRCHLAKRKSLNYKNGKRKEMYLGARVFTIFLESVGVVGLSAPCPTPQDPALFREFSEWMHVQRGASNSTLAYYRRTIIELLDKLGSKPGTFTAKGLRDFLLRRIEHSSHGKSKQVATAMRVFLRFLVAQGDCAIGLDHAVPPIAGWRLSQLPKYLPAKDVERLIDSCDQALPLGARDRAMLLLMARLGLRAGDVSALKFGDLHWTDGALIVSGKSRHEVRLPLPQEVGEAILHYLNHGRPRLANDHLFITGNAPFGPITRSTVGLAVSRALQRTGITSPKRGSHLLRHSLATSMLRDGVSLPAIGALLRHTSIETTTIYAKVDFASLRDIVMPWPEV